MYYIYMEPSPGGNHSAPRTTPFNGALALPDELLDAYIKTRGFAILTVENGAVTEVRRNDAAYDAYIASHPEEPGGEAAPDPQDDTDSMLVDHELRITMLELGVTE